MPSPLFDIRDLTKMYSMGEVQVHALRQVNLTLDEGQFVVLLGPSGSGKSTRAEPSGFMKVSALGVEEQRVNVIIDFVDASTARRLGDGYRVEVRVVIWRKNATLKAPIGSLFRRRDQWAAFVVENGRSRLQRVQLGQRNDHEGQVLEGLSEGQALVLHPPDTLADGARITIRARESSD